MLPMASKTGKQRSCFETTIGVKNKVKLKLTGFRKVFDKLQFFYLAGYVTDEAVNPIFRIFFGIPIIFPQIQSGQSTDASGLAGKIVIVKCQDRQTCRFNSTAYS
jgi:hypothetical protein